jgi:hypothetical protein
MPNEPAAAATNLFSFAEAAEALGVDLEKLLRLVVEDRSIDFVLVDRGGNRKSLNLPGFLADGSWRVDQSGRLCAALPVLEQGRIVGTKYEPLDVGELRIERGHLDEYLASVMAATRVEHSLLQHDGVSTRTPAIDVLPAPAGKASRRQPKGLTPAALSSAFAGIQRDEAQWNLYLSKNRPKWLMTEPVLPTNGRGSTGNGPGRRKNPHLRNPVEFAKHLMEADANLWRRIDRAFTQKIELAEWLPFWEEDQQTESR